MEENDALRVWCSTCRKKSIIIRHGMTKFNPTMLLAFIIVKDTIIIRTNVCLSYKKIILKCQ